MREVGSFGSDNVVFLARDGRPVLCDKRVVEAGFRMSPIRWNGRRT
jgi:hypothetical protein